MLLQKEEVKLVEQLILNCPVCRQVSELMKNETLQVKMKKVLLCCCPGCKKWMLVSKTFKAKSIDKIFPFLKQCY